MNMAEDLPRRSLNTESAGGYRAHSLFFTPENEGQDFNTVLQDVQEYISGKYSALITEGGDEDAKAQIKRYITKYVQDRRIAVKGYSGDQLVDALYTEMAEFGLLTKYIFGTGIEEINVNSWRDIEVLYANGETVKLEEHFDSPEHAVNVIRRMGQREGHCPQRLTHVIPGLLGLYIAVGRSIRCTCLGDGEQTRWNRTDFTGVLKEEFLPGWAREKLEELQGQNAGMGGMEMT